MRHNPTLAKVDVVALDGDHGGTALPWGGWLTPTQIFNDSLNEMKKLTSRPLIIAETGSAEQGGSNAVWITALFRLLRANTQIGGLILFDYQQETDWTVTSSTPAARAFREATSVFRISDRPTIGK